MNRLKMTHAAQTAGNTDDVLAEVEKEWGMLPNFIRAMAGSPAVLTAYRGISRALENSHLSARLREQIALTVAEINRSEYCLAAHTAIGQATGLSEEEILDSRLGTSPDSRTGAVLLFARQVLKKQGRVSGSDLERLKKFGFTDREIGEIVATVVLNILTNYFNNVTAPPFDFPRVPSLQGIFEHGLSPMKVEAPPYKAVR